MGTVDKHIIPVQCGQHNEKAWSTVPVEEEEPHAVWLPARPNLTRMAG